MWEQGARPDFRRVGVGIFDKGYTWLPESEKEIVPDKVIGVPIRHGGSFGAFAGDSTFGEKLNSSFSAEMQQLGIQYRIEGAHTREFCRPFTTNSCCKNSGASICVAFPLKLLPCIASNANKYGTLTYPCIKRFRATYG
jgi:hypothetical protein